MVKFSLRTPYIYGHLVSVVFKRKKRMASKFPEAGVSSYYKLHAKAGFPMGSLSLFIKDHPCIMSCSYIVHLFIFSNFLVSALLFQLLACLYF